MRLTELEPRWGATQGRKGMALNFLCPACQADKSDPHHMLGVWFANPLDGGPMRDPALTPNAYRWTRTGETFAELTLAPSINYEGHWHGFIRNGEIINA